MSYKVKTGDAAFPETRGRKAKYPFPDLGIDDYFDVPFKDVSGMRTLASNATYWSRTLKTEDGKRQRTFSVRTMTKEGVYRVKRTG